MFAGGVRFYTSVVFLIQQLELPVSCLFLVSLHVVGIESGYFVVYLPCVYINVRLIMSSYLLFCISFAMFGISHAVQMKRSSACKVIVEVLVLGLLVVVYKIPYSSCM